MVVETGAIPDIVAVTVCCPGAVNGLNSFSPLAAGTVPASCPSTAKAMLAPEGALLTEICTLADCVTQTSAPERVIAARACSTTAAFCSSIQKFAHTFGA